MLEFICNLCGEENKREMDEFDREAATCGYCESTVRARSLIYVLSNELFGTPLTLPEFPTLKGIRGLGLSDSREYTHSLAYKFDYRNTFYTAEPRFDITKPPDDLIGSLDFLIASEVFEHVPPPIENALVNACRLLKPNGVLLITVPYTFEPGTTEHYPALHDYSLVELAGTTVLVNRTRDGQMQVFDNLVFHGGHGSTLEIRRFSEKGLRAALLDAGFSDLQFYGENHLPYGIVHRQNWSLPLAARKQPFALDRKRVTEVAQQFRENQQGGREQVRAMGKRIAGLEDRVSEVEKMYVEVEAEMQERTRWAQQLEKLLEERKQWSERLQADAEEVRAHVAWLNESAWTKLGRLLRVLPLRADRSLTNRKD